jgi:acyl CoA:acetate/3-ketoacid CoA transferase alpha subunit
MGKLSQSQCHSTKGCGKWYPDPSTSATINSLHIPNGQVVSSDDHTSLRYNEHIIYNTAQQCIRYLILVKNNGGYGGY